MNIHIDFETSATVDIKKAGAWIYSRHPDTYILCCCFAIDDKAVNLWIPGTPLPKEFNGDVNFISFNVFFERAIWTNIMVQKYGFKEIPFDKWRCSAALAASYGLPRKLETVAQVLKLRNQKDPRGQKLILKTNGKNRKALTEDEYKTLFDYCRQDVEVERELSQKLKGLSGSEAAVWSLDQKINLRGVSFDRRSIRSAIFIMGNYTADLKKEVGQITKGQIESTNQRDRTLDWLAENGLEMKSLTKGDVEIAINGEIPPKLKRLLEIRQQLARNSVKKFQAMLNAGDTDDRIRDCFMYHGASTGRWTGKLVQFQNLPRGVISDPDNCISIINNNDLELLKSCYPDVMGAISSCIRGMIVAPPGKVLIAADYNAIETRVLFWLAGEKTGLEKFRQGVDLYVDMAKDIYHTAEISKVQRQVGKTAILGLGYQMGVERFKATCEAAGVNISLDLAKHTVQKYREKYEKVVHFWYDSESIIQKAMYENRKKHWLRKNIIIERTTVNSPDKIELTLPSGRKLIYWYPIIIENKFKRLALHYFSTDPVTKQWTLESTYGGKLVENIVQATARDLLAEAMLRLDAAGFDIVLHAHDEVVVEANPEESVELVQHHMEVLPVWAEGLPIKTEAWKAQRYKK